MSHTVQWMLVVVGASGGAAWIAGRAGGQVARLRRLVVPSRQPRRRR